jgi:hypothetical protein
MTIEIFDAASALGDLTMLVWTFLTPSGSCK